MYILTKDDYFDRDQPTKTDQIANVVSVDYQTVVGMKSVEEQIAQTDEIWITPDKPTIIRISYSSAPVFTSTIRWELTVLGTTGTPTGGSIHVDFSTGSMLISGYIIGGSEHVQITAYGKPLELGEKKTASKSDQVSIDDMGEKRYSAPTNHLIQTDAIALSIAEELLDSYKDDRKDVSVSWRGDPALELGDVVQVPEYQKNNLDIRGTFHTIKQSLDFDGTLSETMEGRRDI